MPFATDLEARPRYQFEPTSAPNQAQNCGVTVAAAIADFYLDAFHPIEEGRTLIADTGPYNIGRRRKVMGAPPGKGTNSFQQAAILRARGVPCDVAVIAGIRQLHSIVDSGRRPVLLGLNFRHVPDAVAGHDFAGWHAIKVRAGVTQFGVSGFIVNDPNFANESTDPFRGKRFYPDDVMQRALEASGSPTGVIPSRAKTDPAFTEENEMAILARIKPDAPRLFRVIKGVNLRKGPGDTYPLHWTLPHDEMFRLVGWDIDPVTKKSTEWVVASRQDGTGLFFVPPVHN